MISLIYHSCIDTSNQAFQKAVICRQLVKYWLQRMAEISYSGLAIDLLSKNCSITCEIVTRDKVILICFQYKLQITELLSRTDMGEGFPFSNTLFISNLFLF